MSALATTRAAIREMTLDTSKRGEWLAWCMAVPRWRGAQHTLSR